MKKAMTALTAFIAAACLLMTSCSDERLLRSVDDLIVPPLYYDEYGGRLFKTTSARISAFASPTRATTALR